jgi:hypothetical protein
VKTTFRTAVAVVATVFALSAAGAGTASAIATADGGARCGHVQIHCR